MLHKLEGADDSGCMKRTGLMNENVGSSGRGRCTNDQQYNDRLPNESGSAHFKPVHSHGTDQRFRILFNTVTPCMSPTPYPSVHFYLIITSGQSNLT